MIIGLVGLKGSGKDTIVSELQKRHPKRKIVNMKFAKGLKQLLVEYFNIPRKVYEDPILKEKVLPNINRTARALLIELGTYFRKIDPDCWINYTDNYLENLIEDSSLDTIYIFTDVRFENEIAYLLDKKAYLLDVERPSVYRAEKKLIKKRGYSCLTRWWIKLFMDKSITLDSEWLYFKNRKQTVYTIYNDVLEKAILDLERFLKL